MKAVLIVTGGYKDGKDYEQLLGELTFPNERPYVIGVDGGALWLVRNGYAVDLAVGDFDTIGPEGIRTLERKAIPLKGFAAEKDATDTELAVNMALERKPEQLVIYGGLGNRFDHSLANVHLLWKCLKLGICAQVADPANRIRLIDRALQIGRRYPYVSLIPFSEAVKGITLTGFKYPLCDAVLTWGESLGVSNELVAETGNISIRSGYLLVIESRDQNAAFFEFL